MKGDIFEMCRRQKCQGFQGIGWHHRSLCPGPTTLGILSPDYKDLNVKS